MKLETNAKGVIAGALIVLASALGMAACSAADDSSNNTGAQFQRTIEMLIEQPSGE